jgi:hypothetical protein
VATIINVTFTNLVTYKAAAKLELLVNNAVSDLCSDKIVRHLKPDLRNTTKYD